MTEVDRRLDEICPELSAYDIDVGACSDIIQTSCSDNDLELMNHKLDCFELVTDCEEREALSECQNDLGELSQTCSSALSEVAL